MNLSHWKEFARMFFAILLYRTMSQPPCDYPRKAYVRLQELLPLIFNSSLNSNICMFFRHYVIGYFGFTIDNTVFSLSVGCAVAFIQL